MNKVCLEITNCCDCPNHYIETIYTPDSFEHEEGVYCSKIEDRNSYNKKHRLVITDDRDVKKWSKVPDWCPLCNK